MIKTILTTAALVCSIAFFAHSQIIINEIKLDSGWVELYNAADTAVDISSWKLCKRPNYVTVNSGAVAVISGTLNIPSKGYLVIGWVHIGGPANELGLYSKTPYTDPANVVDYIQYGAIASPSRVVTAVAAGVWSGETDVVPLPSLGLHTLECTNFIASSGDDTGFDDWAAGFNTLGASNHDNVIINEVNLEDNWVELKNTGNAPVSIGSWRLCDRPSYATISSLTVLAGSTTIPADSFLVVEWSGISSSVGELAIYKATPYSNPENIRDYIQYGGVTSPTRAPTAVSAGVWTSTTDVIAFPVVTSNSLENTNLAASSGIETALADWQEDLPTLNAENEADCPPSFTAANGNALTGTETGMTIYATDGSIESDQTISATANVIYDSGSEIDLMPEFEVESGGIFAALQNGCD